MDNWEKGQKDTYQAIPTTVWHSLVVTCGVGDVLGPKWANTYTRASILHLLGRFLYLHKIALLFIDVWLNQYPNVASLGKIEESKF